MNTISWKKLASLPYGWTLFFIYLGFSLIVVTGTTLTAQGVWDFEGRVFSTLPLGVRLAVSAVYILVALYCLAFQVGNAISERRRIRAS